MQFAFVSAAEPNTRTLLYHMIPCMIKMPFSCMLKTFISHKNMIAKINGSRPGSRTIPCRDEFKQNILKKGFDVINDFSANNWSHLRHCTANIGLRSRYTLKQPDVSLYRQPAINDEKNIFLTASLNLHNNILLRGVY